MRAIADRIPDIINQVPDIAIKSLLALGLVSYLQLFEGTKRLYVS